ncbi:MAG TPA: NAD-dependent epimerase/dehydratase family protein [Pirellulales bacterium]|jgi:dihydroflavonol-4-reductase|nr:NAD-dependent epimerase/dehydratase family protein [Pirellulales bacterium]
MVLLVTGATGLLGNNVVRLALERGRAVRVLRRSASADKPLAGLDVEIVVGDVCDAGCLRKAMRGVDRVIHAAGHVHIGWSGLDTHRAINVEGTRNVARAARDAGARMVHISTVDTLGLGTRAQPADEETPADAAVRYPYVQSKRQGEAVVLDLVREGLDAVIVNPAFMLGPWDWKPSSGRMLLDVVAARPMLAPRGGNDFCDVRDVADGILRAMDRGKAGRRYVLGGEPLRYLEAWRMFAEVAGSRGPVVRAGPMMVWVVGRSGDLWHRVTGREPLINSAATELSSLPHHFSYARAAAELGYAPRPARQAAEAAWHWFLEYGYARAIRRSP